MQSYPFFSLLPSYQEIPAGTSLVAVSLSDSANDRFQTQKPPQAPSFRQNKLRLKFDGKMTQKLIVLFSTTPFGVRIESGVICCYSREYSAVLRD
jgi:hypothetical protein